ncbi:hypothetical protein B0F90DRAFT_1730949 [Multifurca ochricompacta]|uniref:NmrA-like domain-containing protein n=1 Tax=Multifurca ochricompacta TaxID=376703 RepID=A0AAD4M3B9_9AGAM|nr:hypothetical protein B0F90DRAFT_1730949 [Multifurca ochricompacta]
MATTVFFLGATGYIGGPVLAELSKAHPTTTFIALVRRPESIALVTSFGPNFIEQQAREADVVINTANSDNLQLATAILTGQRKRVEVDGKPRGAFVHTSGAAIFLDPESEGAYDPQGRIWNDGNPADIRALTPNLLHGDVDVPIMQASETGYVESHIICPGGVVGVPRGPAQAGSMFFKFLIQLATERKRSCYFGEGTNTLYLADVNDLIDLFLLVFDRVVSGADKDSSPYERYYIGAINPVSFKEIMTAVGEELASRKVLEDGTAASIRYQDVSDPLLRLWGQTQRLEPTRGKSIGWNPKPVDIRASLSESVDAVLNPTQSK